MRQSDNSAESSATESSAGTQWLRSTRRAGGWRTRSQCSAWNAFLQSCIRPFPLTLLRWSAAAGLGAVRPCRFATAQRIDRLRQATAEMQRTTEAADMQMTPSRGKMCMRMTANHSIQTETDTGTKAKDARGRPRRSAVAPPAVSMRHCLAMSHCSMAHLYVFPHSPCADTA